MRLYGRPLALAALAAALLGACDFKFPGSDAATVGSKGLWVANGTDVIEFLPAQFVNGSTNAIPHLQLKSAVFGAPQGVTFDNAGNLWVVDPTGMVSGSPTPALFGFTAKQVSDLGTANAPAPTVTITSTLLHYPQQLQFDTGGNVWVTDHDNNVIQVFAASDLAQSGSRKVFPALTITSAGFNGPMGLTFDAAGNLWVANHGSVVATGGTTSAAGSTIVEFAAINLPGVVSGLAQTVSLKPDIALSVDGKASIVAPWGIAFDADGNLWASNKTTLVEFARSALKTGSPAPSVILSSKTVDGNPSIDTPQGLCIDDVGNLAAINSERAFGIPFYGEKQLSSGAPVPDTFIIGTATTLDNPAGCVYGPAAS